MLGNVNGIIGGVRYGSYQQGNTLSQSFYRDGNIQNSFNEVGVLSFDTTQDTLTLINCSYLQSADAQRFVNVSIVDASNPLTEYYAASNEESTSGFKTFSIDPNTPVDPLPVGNVNMLILVNKSGGQGEFNFTCETERERS